MMPVVVAYNAALLFLVLGGLGLLSQLRPRRPALLTAFLAASLGLAGFFGTVLAPVGGFGKIQLLAWAAFVHIPGFSIGTALLSRRRDRPLSAICVAVAASLLLVGLDAFLVEPRWLQLTRITLPTGKLDVPLRVAVVTDLQTDRLGAYEEQVLALVAAQQPDLVLLGGDYLQIPGDAAYAAAKRDLNALLQRAGIAAPLGIYAVKGNVDRPDWPELFSGLPVTPFRATTRHDLGPLVLTGLTLEDSSNPALRVAAARKFHLVLGHSPDYSLGQIDADILLAGHTHGGQIRLPLLGPVLTLSQVPRSRAAGVTEIAPGTTLIVSRGIGLERDNAPRMRFLCRPELLILDLVPAE